jgi:hypothetical protein
MGRVGALPSSGFQPSTLPAPLQEQIQQTLFGMALNETGAKLGEYRMVKPWVSQFQAEGVFPSQPIANGVSGLAIRQAFHKLQHRDQCQAPRSFGGLTMRRKQIGKDFIGVDGTKRVT